MRDKYRFRNQFAGGIFIPSLWKSTRSISNAPIKGTVGEEYGFTFKGVEDILIDFYNSQSPSPTTIEPFYDPFANLFHPMAKLEENMQKEIVLAFGIAQDTLLESCQKSMIRHRLAMDREDRIIDNVLYGRIEGV